MAEETQTTEAKVTNTRSYETDDRGRPAEPDGRENTDPADRTDDTSGDKE